MVRWHVVVLCFFQAGLFFTQGASVQKNIYIIGDLQGLFSEIDNLCTVNRIKLQLSWRCNITYMETGVCRLVISDEPFNIYCWYLMKNSIDTVILIDLKETIMTVV